MICGPFLQVQEKGLRRCSPFLERSSIPGDDAATDLRSNEWEVVPDIWRSSADKYGDRVAVLDPFRMNSPLSWNSPLCKSILIPKLSLGSRCDNKQ
ncbi:hypothetical protein YC2023_050083 [Brassica napus]